MYAIGQIFKFEPDTLINVEGKPRRFICLGFSFGLLYLISCSSQIDRYHHTGSFGSNPHFILRRDGTGLALDSVIDFIRKIECVDEATMDRAIEQNQITEIAPPIQKEQMQKLYKTMMSKYRSEKFMQDALTMSRINECFLQAGYK